MRCKSAEGGVFLLLTVLDGNLFYKDIHRRFCKRFRTKLRELNGLMSQRKAKGRNNFNDRRLV